MQNYFHDYLLTMGMAIFAGAFPSSSFLWLFPPFQTLHFLLFSFQGVWQDTSPVQLSPWGVSPHTGLFPENWTSPQAHSAAERRECSGLWEWLRGQSGKYEDLLKLPFLLSLPSLIDSSSWRNSCGMLLSETCLPSPLIPIAPFAGDRQFSPIY